MCLRVFLNSLGLFFDISGAILIWKYGLPEILSRKGEVHLILEQTDESEKAKAKKYDFFSHVGIFLLVLGFALQLISNFL